MTMENAILELAAAIRYHADKTAGGTGDIAKLIENVTGRGVRGSSAEEAAADFIPGVKSKTGDPELETDVAKVETDAKAALSKEMDKPNPAKAEIAAAALEKSKAEKEAAKPTPVVEEDPLDAAPLDWNNDIRPVLLKTGKDELVKLMAKYEISKGGKAPAEKWADLLAEANAIVAARG